MEHLFYGINTGFLALVSDARDVTFLLLAGILVTTL